jgi:hypothetical protein
MPMIVDPDAPQITPPVVVTSPEGWLRATVDGTWAGVVLAVDYTAGTPLDDVADVLKVLITRQDPGSDAPAPVRSADTAWAVEGVGTAYDHEVPLGVAVVYTAVPLYTGGTTGTPTSLAITVPAPAAGPGDVWIKSLDTPGMSARVTVTAWPQLSWGARIDQANVMGSPYPIAAQDVYGAPTSSITLDAEGAAIEKIRALLTTPGVLLVQTRPDYHRADQYVLLSNPQQALVSIPTAPRTYTADLVEVGRPDTTGQPLRLPGWSWDQIAADFATWDAVAASYTSWASLSVNGAL